MKMPQMAISVATTRVISAVVLMQHADSPIGLAVDVVMERPAEEIERNRQDTDNGVEVGEKKCLPRIH